MIRSLVAVSALAVSSLSFSVAAASRKPNLLLITVDSARADRMGFLGGKAGVSTNLDRLAAESMVFERAFSQSPSTVVSHATVLSGAYPQSTGINEIGGELSPSLPSLPELLKSQGYRTAAFVSSIELDPQNGLAQGFQRGFETYDAGFRPPIPGDARPPVIARSGEQSVARALAWLASDSKAPFLLWIHIADAEQPHSSYNSALAAADSAIGKLIGNLQRTQRYENTAIILVGAHGQSLGDHGEMTHGIFLYDETIRVPLLIRLPATAPAAKPSRVTGKVSLVDIAPTMLEIAACAVPSQMQGQSLLRIARGEAGEQAVYSRSDLPQRGFGWSPLESWRAGKYLYIRAPKPELYDLVADPGAAHNLAQSAKATLDTMAAQLDAFDRHFSGAGKSSAQLSSSEMEKLASLGYIGLQKPSGTATAAAGTDPKDKITVANQVLAAITVTPDRAISALEPLLAADPNLYLGQYALGIALARKGHYAEAAKHFHSAIELQPDSDWAHFEIGATLMQTRDFKTAIVHLEIATRRLPDFAPAHTLLGQAHEYASRAGSAKDDAKKTGAH